MAVSGGRLAGRRSRIQDKRSAQPHHRRFVGRGAPAVVVWGVSPWYDAYSPADVAPDGQQSPNPMTVP
jgi:hypothetical protein